MNWEVLTMRSATSYFKTLVRSDLRHYWPICFGYTFIWVIMLPVMIVRDLAGMDRQYIFQMAAEKLQQYYIPAIVMAVCFGVITAMACFSYMMNNRSVGLLHSLPAKRGTHFLAHFTSGMGMLLCGNVVTFLLALLAEISVLGSVDTLCLRYTLWWFVITTALDFIFFTVGIFCAMFTGWLLAVPVLYVGLNFAAAVIYLLLDGLAMIFYVGYDGSGMTPFVTWLTPIANLAELCNKTYAYNDFEQARINGEPNLFFRAVLIYTVVALVLLGISYILYQLRHSEAAGDSVAFKWAKPIFRYVIALVGGLALGLGLYMLIWESAYNGIALLFCLLLMTVLCYFVAEMLICKSLRVFKQGWKGLVVSCAVIVLLFIGMGVDLFGVESYVPEASQVQYVDISICGNDSANANHCMDKETILAAIDAHEAALWQGRGGSEDGVTLDLTYTLKSGKQVRRSYWTVLEKNSDLYKALNVLGNTDSVRRSTLLREARNWKADGIRGGYISLGDQYGQMSAEQARELFKTFLTDVDADIYQWDVGVNREYEYCGIEFEGGAYEWNTESYASFYLDQIPVSFTNTLKMIHSMQFENDQVIIK